MAKQKKTEIKIGGPFLAAAVICESIMEDSNKTLSAIKIVDGVQIWISPQAPPDVPSKTSPIQILQNALITFKTGDSPGKHTVKLVMQQPDGQRGDLFSQAIEFTKEPQGGCNVKASLNMTVY